MSSCALVPKVKNLNGENKESKLFKNLLSLISDRTKTIENYVLGKNEEFLDLVEDQVKFDENGEITAKSLIDVADIDIKEDEIISKLNSQIKAGEYDYDEAIRIIQEFNLNNSMKDDYLATLSPINGNKVKVEIVPKTSYSYDKLVETIKNRSLQDRLKWYLSKYRVSVSFLEEPNIDGRYSTENVEKTIDGFYNLVQIAKGNKGEEALAEETGHFIIGALGENPLVERLLKILTPENQQKILGEDKYLEIMGRLNPDREVAGYLVGEALKKEPDNKTIIDKLINRIINTAKKIFYRVKGDELGLLKVQASEIAEKIAEGFVTDNFEGNLLNALNKKETLYSAPDTKAISNLKRVIKILLAQAIRMKDLDYKHSKNYFELLDQVQKGKILDLPNNILADSLAVKGIADAIEMMSFELISVQQDLASLDFNYDSINPETAKKLRKAELLIKNAIVLKAIVDEMTIPGLPESYASLLTSASTHQLYITLMKETSKTLRDLLDILAPLSKVKNKEFFAKFLEMGLGDKVVPLIVKKVFHGTKLTTTTMGTNEKGLDITVMNLLDYLEDEGFLSSFLTSMSNSKSLTNQIVDRTFRRLKKKANDDVREIRNRLVILEKLLKDIGGKTEEFFERDPNTGKLTGNIIDEYLWGVLEREYEELYLREKINFNNNFDKTNKSRNQITAAWVAYWNPILKLFVESHYDTINDKLIPKRKYKNQEYIKSIKGTPKEQWLKEYKGLKESIDKQCLGKHASVHRAPLFKGLNIRRLRNRMSHSSFGSALGKTIWENVTETFLEDSEDRDFGSNLTYNPTDLYADDQVKEEDRIQRVPLFGINKLKDMDALSTDLFHSTLAYASMAYRYNISNLFMDILEIGREILSETRVTKKIIEQGEKRLERRSRMFTRFEKFLDKELYGFKTYKMKLGPLVYNKVAGFLTGIASKIYLGGNVAGGTVNFATGWIEVFKEAVASEHFTIALWHRANLEYMKHLPENWMQAGEVVKYDKISLLIDRFDTKNQAEEKAYGYHPGLWKLHNLNPVGHNLFLPYTVGEHYMQTIAYLAIACGTMLTDTETGKQVSLYDALESEDILSNEKVVGKKLVLKSTYIKDKDKLSDYKMLQSISKTLNDSSLFISFTSELEAFMQANGMSPHMSKEENLSKIRELLSNMVWSQVDESDFMDKAREVNNRLHGIYNSQDKTLFHQNLFLNMMTSMRNYAFGMINRRFGPSIYSLSLGHDVEGSLITVGKVIASTFTDEGGFLKTLRLLACPFGDSAKLMMLNMGFSANQFANMRRNFADGSFIALLTILKLALAGGKGEGDEEDDLTMGIAYYFVSRLLRELSAFNTPWGFVEEVPVLTSIELAALSIILEMGEWGKLGLLTLEDDEEAFYLRSGAYYKKGDSKLFYKFKRLCPYYRSYMLLLNPYQAAESYQYGRANKAK